MTNISDESNLKHEKLMYQVNRISIVFETIQFIYQRKSLFEISSSITHISICIDCQTISLSSFIIHGSSTISAQKQLFRLKYNQNLTFHLLSHIFQYKSTIEYR